MSQDQMPTPEWDQLIAERGGRGPTEFEGHDTWDDSEEARQAYDRGVAEAKATQAAFWGRAEGPVAAPAAAVDPAPTDRAPTDRVPTDRARADLASAGPPASGSGSATTGTKGTRPNGSAGAGPKATRSTRTKPAAAKSAAEHTP